MGGCIKVVLNYFFDFLEKKKSFGGGKFFGHIFPTFVAKRRVHFLAQNFDPSMQNRNS
jgi:hypothetical protein